MSVSVYPEIQTVLDENGDPVEIVQGSTGKAIVQDEDVKGILLAILSKLENIENQLNNIND